VEQPLHVFDFDKLEGGITVRRAVGGEQLLCLDGKTRALQSDMLVIADAARPVVGECRLRQEAHRP